MVSISDIRGPLCVGLLAAVASFHPATGSAQATHATCGGDNQRTSWNRHEAGLTQVAVSSPRFKRLWSVKFDSATYGEPLYLPDVAAQGTSRNLLIGVSTRNSIYAVDADSGEVVWSHLALEQADDEEGAYSTPVFDPASGSVFMLTRTVSKEVASFKLWVFEAASGKRLATPLAIDHRTVVGFPRAEISSRGGLLIHGGKLYVAFGGGKAEVSAQMYHGTIVEVDVSRLHAARPRVFQTTRDMKGGGIWGDCGLAVDDAGALWAASANCNGEVASYAAQGAPNYCQSIVSLKLPLQSLPSPRALFTPANVAWLDNTDQGFCTSPVVLNPPGSKAAFVASTNKDGFFYLANANDPTGSLFRVMGSRLFLCGQMALFASGEKAYFYSMGRGGDERDTLSGVVAIALRFGGATVAEVDPKVAWRQSRPRIAAINGLQGSSNGDRDPIVWTVMSERDAKNEVVSRLAAFDALSGAQIALGGGHAGDAAFVLPSARRFRAPTVAASKVFVPAHGIVAFGVSSP